MSRGPTEEVRLYQIRVALKPAAAIEDEAKAEGKAVSHVLRRIVEDYATLYGLSRSQFETLEADRKALKLDRPEYFKELLDHRYRFVLANGPGATAPAHALAQTASAAPASAAGGRKK
jgi:hypothetical protein